MTLSLTDLQTAHPSGVYSEAHGCYYFLDHDNELGYFIQYNTGEFENEPDWVELDTLADDERQECEAVAAQISLN